MMPLTEIDRLKRTVTPAWESPIADQVAAAWGYPAGTAKWWRSSASHVFVLPDPSGKRYLRFVPDAYRGAGPIEAVSALMDRLAADGTAVVRPVPDQTGALTATVTTTLGPMHAMVVEAAPGEALDADDLTADRARAWGAALASVHEGAAELDTDLPEAFTELAEIPDRFADDPVLVKAAASLSKRLAGLPRDRTRFGIVHGDFELDNLAWDAGRTTAFDFDEAARSWYAADIAYALRDLTGPDGNPEAAHREHFQAFITGYRSVRPFDEGDLANLRLFAGLHAACSLARITRALGAPGDGDPEWMAELRATLIDMARSHRELTVTVAEA
ncbi:phosphotransferase enzyme family protein [Glycomyces buryatensis]|uniref:Aminoglycoside phosphotransferase n=1 Tax=Glycomyces buryatensis TaxID=2570927 RepID=A0A4S8PXV8_9ACTN|nr:phosphotransferase [Glycomyces buryatensis]THV36440.1 aminoglycoside phosphotransferase [Glycomyces buryatensis]